MIQKIKKLAPHHKFALLLLSVGIISVLLGGLYGLRLTRQFQDRPPLHNRQSDVSGIQEWMTLRYVARAYGTPEPELEKALGIPAHTYERSSLSQIAKATGTSTEHIITKVRETITSFQSAHPTPQPK
jgi:hypothetical protein